MAMKLSNALSLFFFLVPSCYLEKESTLIKFVFKNNFKGVIVFKIDENKGNEIKFQDGYRTLFIPENGIMIIKNDNPFAKWHETIAIYENGSQIPIAFEEESKVLPENTVQFYHGGYYSGERYGAKERGLRFFVGTDREYEKYLAIFWPEPGPLPE